MMPGKKETPGSLYSSSGINYFGTVGVRLVLKKKQY